MNTIVEEKKKEIKMAPSACDIMPDVKKIKKPSSRKYTNHAEIS